MSASHSEPMGARGWEPEFRSKSELEREARSIRVAVWNAHFAGRLVPAATIEELKVLETQIRSYDR